MTNQDMIFIMSLPIVPLIIAGVAILLSKSSSSGSSNSGSSDDNSSDSEAPRQMQFVVPPQMKHGDLVAQVQDIWGGGQLSNAEATELAVAASSAVFPEFPDTVEEYQNAVSSGSTDVNKNRYKNIFNYTMGVIGEITGQMFYFGG